MLLKPKISANKEVFDIMYAPLNSNPMRSGLILDQASGQ